MIGDILRLSLAVKNVLDIDMLEVYIDGACEPKNPGGTASYGIIVQRWRSAAGPRPGEGSEWWERVWEDYGIIGTGPKMSNNVSEYFALTKFFEWLDEQPVEDVIVYSDSKLLVNQMNYEWEIRHGLYKPYALQCIAWMVRNADFWKGKIKFDWIPREENIADELTVKALSEVGIVRKQRS